MPTVPTAKIVKSINRLGAELDEDDMQQRRHQVPHQQDRQIGRAVIGAVVVEFLLADGAMVMHLEIAEQQRTGTAVRASAGASRASSRAGGGVPRPGPVSGCVCCGCLSHRVVL